MSLHGAGFSNEATCPLFFSWVVRASIFNFRIKSASTLACHFVLLLRTQRSKLKRIHFAIPAESRIEEYV